jgi:septal ring factor EnvC (AmiA/AmiB activator)
MPKQRIDLTVDHDVWFYFRTNNINVSSLVNDILKTRMQIQDERKDEQELEKEITDLSEQIISLSRKRDELQMHLIKVRQDNAERLATQEKESAERMNRLKSTVRSIQRSRGFQDGI